MGEETRRPTRKELIDAGGWWAEQFQKADLERIDRIRERDEARQRAGRAVGLLQELREAIHQEALMRATRKFQLANWETQIRRVEVALAADPQPAEAGGEPRPAPKDKKWIKMEHSRGAVDQPAEAGGEE